jgi:hypothetical protein
VVGLGLAALPSFAVAVAVDGVREINAASLSGNVTVLSNAKLTGNNGGGAQVGGAGTAIACNLINAAAVCP